MMKLHYIHSHFYTASCLQINSIKLVEETEKSQQNVQYPESGWHHDSSTCPASLASAEWSVIPIYMKLRNLFGMDHAAELMFCYKMLCGCSAEDDYRPLLTKWNVLIIRRLVNFFFAKWKCKLEDEHLISFLHETTRDIFAITDC